MRARAIVALMHSIHRATSAVKALQPNLCKSHACPPTRGLVGEPAFGLDKRRGASLSHGRRQSSAVAFRHAAPPLIEMLAERPPLPSDGEQSPPSLSIVGMLVPKQQSESRPWVAVTSPTHDRPSPPRGTTKPWCAPSVPLRTRRPWRTPYTFPAYTQSHSEAKGRKPECNTARTDSQSRGRKQPHSAPDALTQLC